MLNIFFGWHLDGAAHPNTVSGAHANIGNSVVGPNAFIEVFATLLGLTRMPVGRAAHIARYLAALSACDNGNQFYSQSFQLDPWSTANYLLLLRDELISNGWNDRLFKIADRASTGLLQLSIIRPQSILPQKSCVIFYSACAEACERALTT